MSLNRLNIQRPVNPPEPGSANPKFFLSLYLSLLELARGFEPPTR